MDKVGMGGLLTVGWLVLGAYLVVLMALSATITAASAVRGWFFALANWSRTLSAARREAVIQ